LIVVEVLSMERRPEGVDARVVRDAVKYLVLTEVGVGVSDLINRSPLSALTLDPCTHGLVFSVEDASSGTRLIAELAVVKYEVVLMRVDIADLAISFVLDLPLLVVLTLG
jgi:hypothetical protein